MQRLQRSATTAGGLVTAKSPNHSRTASHLGRRAGPGQLSVTGDIADLTATDLEVQSPR
jgi:hypothetical protein